MRLRYAYIYNIYNKKQAYTYNKKEGTPLKKEGTRYYICIIYVLLYDIIYVLYMFYYICKKEGTRLKKEGSARNIRTQCALKSQEWRVVFVAINVSVV